MPSNRPQKTVSVQTYRYSANLVVRLEYDSASEQQRVFLNNELKSAFFCPPGMRAEHLFRASDELAEAEGHESVWRVKFAAEQASFRIRFEIDHRHESGDDTKWYWCDRNVEPDEWDTYPAVGGQSSTNETREAQCECGEELVCRKCDFEPNHCSECGGSTFCLTCDHDRIPRPYHDTARIQEALSQLDSARLQDALIDAIERQPTADTSWVQMLADVLGEAGYDVDRIQCRSDDQPED